jgi:hypothetical protein
MFVKSCSERFKTSDDCRISQSGKFRAAVGCWLTEWSLAATDLRDVKFYKYLNGLKTFAKTPQENEMTNTEGVGALWIAGRISLVRCLWSCGMSRVKARPEFNNHQGHHVVLNCPMRKISYSCILLVE